MKSSAIRNLVIVLAVIVLVAGVGFVRQSNKRNASATSDASSPAALPRMLDLGSDKCAACKQMVPILTALRTEYAGRAIIDFTDVFKQPDAFDRYGIRVIPTQIFYDRTGNEVSRHEGALSKDDIMKRLKELGAQ